MKNILISKHVIFVKNDTDLFTTGSGIEVFLQNKNIDYICIKHPLNNVSSSLGDDFIKRKVKSSTKNYPSSLIEFFSKKKLTKKIISYSNKSFLPVKTIQEFIITYNFINNLKKPVDLFIAIDPLNALYAIVLKKLGKVNNIIYYTADYAYKRFNNPLLNWIYHAIDRMAIRYSNQVWNVSSRIVAVRKKQGLIPSKNVFVPNSPSFDKKHILDIKNINKHEIIIVGTNSNAINFNLIFKVLSNLKKKYPDIVLKIIGYNVWENFANIINNYKIKNNIKIYGKLNHETFLNELSKSSIGLAYYTNEVPWNYFCDSMKIRDFFACGLPVITNNLHGIAEDINKYKAGYIVNFNEIKLTQIIDKLFSDVKQYATMRNNAINLAKRYDINKLLTELLSNYINN